MYVYIYIYIYTYKVNAVAFGPQESLVVSGSSDKSVRISREDKGGVANGGMANLCGS